MDKATGEIIVGIISIPVVIWFCKKYLFKYTEYAITFIGYTILWYRENRRRVKLGYNKLKFDFKKANEDYKLY